MIDDLCEGVVMQAASPQVAQRIRKIYDRRNRLCCQPSILGRASGETSLPWLSEARPIVNR